MRAVGKDATEALALFERLRGFEAAGAFAVEMEVVAAPALAVIRQHVDLATISLGSGADADVTFLFTEDVCGETAGSPPRHARSWGRLDRLHEQIQRERIEALQGFASDVRASRYPAASETVDMPDEARLALIRSIDRIVS